MRPIALIALLTLPALTGPRAAQKSNYALGAGRFQLEALGEHQFLSRFEGSAQRAEVQVTNAAGKSTQVAKGPPIVTTAADMTLVPGPGMRGFLEQSLAGTAAVGTWTVREFDVQLREQFVHELQGVRLSALELHVPALSSKDQPFWKAFLEVERVRLSAGSKGDAASKLQQGKPVPGGGLRVNLDGVELARVVEVDGLRFEMPSSQASSSSRTTAQASLAGPVRVRLGGDDVKPWLDRLGGKSSVLEIEVLRSPDPKQGAAATVTLEQSQLVAVLRPGNPDANVFDLEFQCAKPRLRFP